VIVVGVGSVALFHYLKIDTSILPAAIVTAGITLLQAASHAEVKKELVQTRTELVTLRAAAISTPPPSLLAPIARTLAPPLVVEQPAAPPPAAAAAAPPKVG
jgi:hypothetical protein